MGCAVRGLVAAVVLIGLVAAGTAGVSGTDAVAAGADAALVAVGETAQAGAEWGWSQVAAVPWSAAPRAVGRLARGLGAAIGDAATALSRTESGEPLGAGRLAVYAAGWVIVLAVVAWIAVRRAWRWAREAWQDAMARRAGARRDTARRGRFAAGR